MTPQELQNRLADFNGSDTIYLHSLHRMKFSEGCKFLAENAGAWWLIEDIMSYRLDRKLSRMDMQFWKLTTDVAAGTATLVCTNGNDKRSKVKKEYETADFPLPVIEIWVENNTLVLPMER